MITYEAEFTCGRNRGKIKKGMHAEAKSFNVLGNLHIKKQTTRYKVNNW